MVGCSSDDDNVVESENTVSGLSSVTNLDGSNRLIRNPAKANHNYGPGINYKDGGILLWVKK